MRQQQAKAIARSLFDEQTSPFGAFSLGSQTHQAATVPDLVRRARWIAVDLNAAEFAIFMAGPSAQRPVFAPGFDSAYPAVSASTRLLAGDRGEAVLKHARVSTIPCWWSGEQACTSSRSLSSLGWAVRVEPLLAGAGIAFPVYADNDRCGLAVFTGDEINLGDDRVFEIHARCFAVFAAFVRIKPVEKTKTPSISKRELECLKLTASGYTSEDIARTLKLSVHTANQYLANTTQKLDAVNRMHAVAKALRMGLIE